MRVVVGMVGEAWGVAPAVRVVAALVVAAKAMVGLGVAEKEGAAMALAEPATAAAGFGAAAATVRVAMEVVARAVMAEVA